jgi:hypothetical protein
VLDVVMSGVPPVATAPVAAVVVLAQRAGGGPVVRNYPLDHPPTLVHVRRGDMGLVGPRPVSRGGVA